MSQENVEIVRVLYERLRQTGEPDRAFYAPDATFDAGYMWTDRLRLRPLPRPPRGWGVPVFANSQSGIGGNGG